MRLIRLCAVILVAGACASAGGGPLPEAGEPTAAMGRAEALIADAAREGADSLANEAITSARTNLAAAQKALGKNDINRAALKARAAEADATYAKAAAERAKADRTKGEAATALSALPPGGAR
jgi:hypothetical protein